MPINHRAHCYLAGAAMDPPFARDTPRTLELSAEWQGRRVVHSCPIDANRYHYGNSTEGMCGLAKEMIQAGFPDGDLHIARLYRPSLPNEQHRPGESYQDWLARCTYTAQPERLSYTGSAGPISKMAAWYDQPHLNHNEGHMVGDKWVHVPYAEIKRLEKWVRAEHEQKFEFFHAWYDYTASYDGRAHSAAEIATGALPPEQWDQIERPPWRKTRFYYVDLQSPTAEFTFLLCWRATGDPISRLLQWRKWGQDG